MKLEVLISTMHQKNHDLIEKMNIQSDAIVINQSDNNNFEEFTYKGNSIRFITLNERGVGLSRNNALMRSNADICLMGDDDVAYVDGYEDIIINAFKNNPKADMIMFNVPSTSSDRPTYNIPKHMRVRWYNCLRYPTYHIAFRRDSQRKANIYFSLLFGGGAKYNSGEDNLFVSDFIKKGLKIYACPETIGHMTPGESTWFKGYNDKFFIDRGVLLAAINKRWAKFFSVRYVLRHRNKFIKDKSMNEALRLLIQGTKEFKK